MVVPQDAAESLSALDLTGGAAEFPARIDQSVVEGLVIALYVIMGQESDHGDTQRSLPEKDQAVCKIDPRKPVPSPVAAISPWNYT